MIACQDIVDRCLAYLDAEGSDRYLWSRDFVHAVGSTNEWMISLFNAAFSSNKLSEEVLNELVRVRVWQLSRYSRFAFDPTSVGESAWTVLSVHPKITSIPATPTLAALADESVYRPDISFRSSAKSAKRLTFEEWSEKSRNPFMSGSSFIACEEIIDYAYLNFADYTGGYSLTNNKFELEVSPACPGELVAMSYVKLPDAPVNATDDLEFPANLLNLVVDKTLNYIAFKQGEAPLMAITDKEINQLASLMT
jgi:hypothetical protein